MNWEALTNIVWEEVQREYASDSCVLSVAVIDDVLERLNPKGFAFEPLPVKLFVFGPPMTEYFFPDGVWPNTEELQRLLKETDAYSLSIGFGPKQGPNKWSGHLVGLIKGDCQPFILDPSLPQAQRAQHGVLLNPLVARVSWEFIHNERVECFHHQGSTLLYFPHQGAESQDFRQGRDWHSRAKRWSIVQRVLARV